MAGELFGRSGLGVGLRKGSPWTHPISLSILELHEGGQMEKLDNKWILIESTECPERDHTPATLGLTNMAGVYCNTIPMARLSLCQNQPFLHDHDSIYIHHS